MLDSGRAKPKRSWKGVSDLILIIISIDFQASGNFHGAWDLGTHNDPVVDLGDAGGGPGNPLRLVALDPRPHGALEDHFAAVRFNGDAIGIYLGAAFECVHDLPLDLG